MESSEDRDGEIHLRGGEKSRIYDLDDSPIGEA